MSEGGNRWGSWWNGRTGRIPNKIVAGVGAGAFGVTLYYGTRPKVDIVPPPVKDSNSGGGGGGGEAPATPEVQVGEANPVEKVVEFITDPTVQVVGAIAVISAIAFLALRRTTGGNTQTA